MEETGRIKNIIEALLVVSENGLSMNDIKTAVKEADERDIERAITELEQEYSSSGRAFNVTSIAGRYRIVTRPEYMPWINNLYEKPMDRLTGPSLETLAIVAYKQPVTRAEIEKVRGVNVGGVLKTLMEKGLLVLKGRKDAPGKPLMYGTTDKFLEIFGLNSLDDLPELRDFSEEDLEYGKPREVVHGNGSREDAMGLSRADAENAEEVKGAGGP